MIAYIDSSTLVRAYLSDEPDHADALALLADADVAAVTGSWTWIEVSGALVRAARAGRGDADEFLKSLDEDLDAGGLITMMKVSQVDAEEKALGLVREYGIRAMDAWHLAAASLMLPELVGPGQTAAFATRDADQAKVAKSLGFEVI
ncbi:MAG TPA: type II toxin-antitoxin system VapC family toxin [Acidimicrobiales bacterium]|nr:type II toxin-antitoxin system VapC family toxin [Acidimicrobiales bacterium]